MSLSEVKWKMLCLHLPTVSHQMIHNLKFYCHQSSGETDHNFFHNLFDR